MGYARHKKLIATVLFIAAAGFLTVSGFVRMRGRAAGGGSSSVVLPAVVRALPSSLVSTSVDEKRGYVDLKLGPVNLPAGSPGLRTPIQLVTMPIQGWIRGFEWHVEDESGKELPNSFLHHVNLIDPARRELFGSAPLRVIAAGTETPGFKLPALLGYPIEPNTQFMVVAMFANPTTQSHPRAYLRLRLRYSDTEWSPRLNIFPFYLDAMGIVGEKSFDVPPGVAKRSWEAQPATDVRILGLGGHAHDFVTALQLEDATTNSTLWRARLSLDPNGELLGVPAKYVWWHGGIKLQKDHRYRITVEYNNTTNQPTPHGGMGVIAGFALGRRDWPLVNPTSAEYLADINNIIAAPTKKMSGMDNMGGHHH